MKATTLSRKAPARSSTRSAQSSTLSIEGRAVPVTHLDKVFYPKAGFTKADVIDYYIRISNVLLPHLKDRPLTLKRYPDGVEGGFFYEKRCPAHRPPWVQTVPIWSENNQAKIHYCMANDLPTIVWAANLGDLELHTSLARGNASQQPTMMVFDLDPGQPANIVDCCQVGLWLRDKLEKLKLKSFAKTSGSKGLQLYVPLNTKVTYDQTKPLSHQLAQELEREHPDRIISRMEKRLRTGKVFVDWSQNDHFKTTVCVYSLRAKERPTVSTPVTWDEVETALKRKSEKNLIFTSKDVLGRVAEHGDLFEPVLTLKQKIG